MNRSLIAATLTLLIVVVMPGCGRADLSPQQAAEVASLRKELEDVKDEIAAAEQKDSELAGGLVKALVGTRIEILKTTEALLQQRVHAVEAGARITVETQGSEPDAQEASRLEQEIRHQEAGLRKAEEDAARYSGGLVLAMKRSTIATQEQTLAMLRQRYLTAKYGLALPRYEAPAAAPPVQVASGSAESVGAEPVEGEGIIEVKLLRKQFTEQDYQEYIFFDFEYTASGLDRPVRAIKGVMQIQDLFGETKLPIGWTIDEPLSPGSRHVEKGKGFEYNQFRSEHSWVRSTDLEDMKAVYRVTSIIYADGTRLDF